MRKLNQKGFTMIEALVSTAIFAFVITSILGTYIAILRLDTRTRSQRAVADDARYIMDFLAKEIRNGQLDYASYDNQLTCKDSCGTGPLYFGSDIYLINQAGEHERIYFWDRTEGSDETKGECRPVWDICDIYLSKNGVATRLNSDKVRVTLWKVYAAPWGDPFTAARSYNMQPFVTVVLELTSNLYARDTVRLNLHSTFSTQYYPARP